MTNHVSPNGEMPAANDALAPNDASTGVRLPLSVCFVAHNEAELIGTAVAAALAWAAEVIVLDCESTDGTADVARKAGAEVHHHPNILPEVSKNDCFALARQPWVLSLDPDEEIPVPLREEIAAVILRDPPEAAFQMPRRNFYFGKPLMHGGQYPNRQLRLFRRGAGRFPGRGPHERMEIAGTVGQLQNAMDHHPYPTLEIWLRKLEFYTQLGVEQLQARNVPIDRRSIRHHMVTRPMRRWLERLLLKRGIRDGVPGVFAASADLITNLISFLKYWMARGKP